MSIVFFFIKFLVDFITSSDTYLMYIYMVLLWVLERCLVGFNEQFQSFITVFYVNLQYRDLQVVGKIFLLGAGS